MKKIISKIAVAFCILILATSCKKSTTNNTNTDNYLPLTNGSSFTYATNFNDTLGSRTYTILSGDTTAYSKAYKRVRSTDGQTFFYNKTGSDYYQILSIDSVNRLEMLFLKDNVAVNGTWTNTQILSNVLINGTPTNIPLTTDYKIISKGNSRTVKGKLFNDIIHSQCNLSVVTPTNILQIGVANFYFAKNIGVVESTVVLNNATIGINENDKYELTAYTIK